MSYLDDEELMKQLSDGNQTDRSGEAVQRPLRTPRVSHTPGPWHALYTRVDDASGYLLCHGDLHGKGEATNAANLRLIAAAPELLSAAEWALDFVAGLTTGCTMEEQGEIHQRLSAAIKKATGA